jgi:hypothetical protein
LGAVIAMEPHTKNAAETATYFKTRFDSFVCTGDTLQTLVDRFTVTAGIVPDMSGESPDARQDRFWPSLYKDAPGFIGAGMACARDLKPSKPAHRA